MTKFRIHEIKCKHLVVCEKKKRMQNKQTELTNRRTKLIKKQINKALELIALLVNTVHRRLPKPLPVAREHRPVAWQRRRKYVLRVEQFLIHSLAHTPELHIHMCCVSAEVRGRGSVDRTSTSPCPRDGILGEAWTAPLSHHEGVRQ